DNCLASASTLVTVPEIWARLAAGGVCAEAEDPEDNAATMATSAAMAGKELHSIPLRRLPYSPQGATRRPGWLPAKRTIAPGALHNGCHHGSRKCVYMGECPIGCSLFCSRRAILP